MHLTEMASCRINQSILCVNNDDVYCEQSDWNVREGGSGARNR